MIPLYLCLSNFQSHSFSEIDFSSFSSALVIGKVDSNELASNGVGKTSIFRAMEYALFNQVRDPMLQKDIVLEKLIRDETNKVSVIFDFSLGEEIFRIVRSRTRKDVSDLSLYRRNAVEGSAHVSETDKKLWDDISSRRTQDTEDDVAKKIRTTYKAFINTNHFMQNDFYGIATATPEKRKALLKETLGLMVYGKLEELAKEKASALLKLVEKLRTEIQFIGQPHKDIQHLQEQLVALQDTKRPLLDQQTAAHTKITTLTQMYMELCSKLNVLESQSQSVLDKRTKIVYDIEQANATIQDYTYKSKSLSRVAKELIEEIGVLKQELEQLSATKSEDLTKLNAEIVVAKQHRDHLHNQIGQTSGKQLPLKEEVARLQLESTQLPSGDFCSHCQQPLTTAHRQKCLDKNRSDLYERQQQILALEQEEASLKQAHSIQKQAVDSLAQQQRLLESNLRDHAFKTKELAAKEKEVAEKRALHQEYVTNLLDAQQRLLTLKAELEQVETEIQNSSVQELEQLRKQVNANKCEQEQTAQYLQELNTQIAKLQADTAITEHTLQQKHNDLQRKVTIEQSIKDAEAEYTIYPSVTSAFSSSGIPNLIIQNMLEDLQTEANQLLTQISPGLQLLFSTEKIKADKTMAETLEITYFLNNKPRDYSQLSGAQRLCIIFGLKLGLSFLLAKRFGSQVKFLLLDEIDQSLDKARTDALFDIIRHFQQDFKILVITHSDRLQNKGFSHAVLVEQDQNMVSTAKVVSSW